MNLQVDLNINDIVTIRKGANIIEDSPLENAIEIDSFDYFNNIVHLKTPLKNNYTIVYTKGASLDAKEMSLIFYYRRRHLRSDLVDDLQSDWTENDPSKGSYISGRPLYQDEDNEIVLKSKEEETYRNGTTNYLDFFTELIKEVTTNDDADTIAALRNELNSWVSFMNAYKDFIQQSATYKYNFANSAYKGKEDEIVIQDLYPGGNNIAPGLINAMTQIANEIHGLKKAIESRTEIYGGNRAPAYQTEAWKNYKIWVNNAENNGNGLVYYNNGTQVAEDGSTKIKWVPVSALWTNGGSDVITS